LYKLSNNKKVPLYKLLLLFVNPELVPTNTTKTAAYVAVATKISVLLALIITAIKNPNSRTAVERVTRLLAVEGVNVIITIGVIRTIVLLNARIPPANKWTVVEFSLGGSPHT
jgi:hypothetical protein